MNYKAEAAACRRKAVRDGRFGMMWSVFAAVSFLASVTTGHVVYVVLGFVYVAIAAAHFWYLVPSWERLARDWDDLEEKYGGWKL